MTTYYRFCTETVSFCSNVPASSNTGTAIVDGLDHIQAIITAQLNDTDVEWEYRETDPDIFGDSLLEPPYAGADRIAAVLGTVTRSS